MAVYERDPELADPGRREALIREARERQRRRRRRGMAALVAALILAGAGFAAFGGGSGGASGQGPLPPGIAARAADPAGGLPWGIRVVDDPTGRTCVQLGRLRGRALGVLGQDASFHDDGRFHPIAPSTVIAARCAPTDAAGHAFLAIARPLQPASGSVLNGDDGPQPQQCRRCAPRDLRFVEYGLLGPDAVSITYRVDGRTRTIATGADGAFLVVGPRSSSLCARVAGTSGCESGGEHDGDAVGAGMVTAIHYRGGGVCRPGAPDSHTPFLAENPQIGASCPPVGYRAPHRPSATAGTTT